MRNNNLNINKRTLYSFYAIFFLKLVFTQNSLVGDGYGGRVWYKPTNYTSGSYSGYSICYSGACNTGTNQLYGWGDNRYQQLGYSSSVMLGCTTPTPVPGMTDVKYYSTGYTIGAIKNNGTGWVWGQGLFSTPTQVITNAKFVDASIENISFVKNDGTVWSLGLNSFGNFGNGTSGISSIIPIQMQGISNAVRTANGSQTTYVLLNDGTVKSCGFNLNGLLGIGNTITTQTLFPITITTLSNIVDIKANTSATAVLDSMGDVYVWGKGINIGDGDTSDESSPKKISALSNIVAISGCADGEYFLALDENKNCFAWGPNIGQFGITSGFGSGPVLTPTLVATDVIDIMAGETFSYIVKKDGSLWCSGASSVAGSIWLNLSNIYRDTFTQLSPNLLPGTCNVKGIAVITSSSCNNNNGIITVSNFGGQLPYQYNIGSGNQASNIFSGLSAGTYTIIIKDNSNCVDTITCTVNVDINSTIADFNSSNSNTLIPLGSSVLFTNESVNATSVKWDFCNNTSSGSNTFTFPFNDSGNCCVKLIAVNNNCKDSVTKCFNVDAPSFVSIPNVFSPNEDGVNDFFKINTKGIKTLHCEIYNRWGQKVYEWNNIDGFWNGKTKTGNAPTGTYFYIVNYSDNEDNSIIENGFLTLFRE